jgi:hypothetical protein
LRWFRNSICFEDFRCVMEGLSMGDTSPPLL